MTRRAAIVAALLATLSPLAAGSQTFEGATSVFEVQVPVQVTDRDGHPIRGLQKEDFRILEKGKEREIRSFEVVDLEILASAGDVPDDTLSAPVPAAARRHFLFLFDLSFSTPGSILKARLAARDFVVNQLHPSDLVAVMTLSLQKGPQLLVTFTPDRAQVARAIDILGVPSLLDSHQAQDPLSFILADPAMAHRPSDAGSSPDDGGMVGSIQDVVNQEISETARVIHRQIEIQNKAWDRGRITSWATTLDGLGRYLDSVQGRKQVVYFSEGFDGRLVLGRGPDAFDERAREDRENLDAGRYWMVDTTDIYGEGSVQRDIRQMLESFKRSNAVIQAVDISGLRAEHAPALRGREVGQDVLFYVANETGGQLLSGANDFGYQLDQVLESTDVTYLLTFDADDIAFDGAYHEIEVKVDGPRGTRVSHREGYYAPRPFDELHPFERSLLTADTIATATRRDEIPVSVLAPAFQSGGGNAYVPVIIEVPGVELLEGHEKGELPVEIFAYVTDENGRMEDYFTQRIGLDAEKGRDALASSGVKYYGHLDLDAGRHLLRVLVRNGATGRTGLQTVSIDVPKLGQTDPVVLGPFFPEPPGRWLLVRERSDDPGSERVVYPFTVKGEPYVPAARAEVEPGGTRDMVLVGYHLEAGDLSLQGRVFDGAGKEVSGGRFEMVERTDTGLDGVDKILARFEPSGLAPGSYDLEVRLSSGESSATARVPLEIR